MKKCIVISDSFKGSLPSRDICAIARERIPLFFPACEVRALNVADGGEGTVDCFLDSCGGERVLVSGVQNPYGEPIDASYGLLPDGTAVIEMAAAAGLPLVAGRKDPCVTTTYGVGQLIADALARGARRITVQNALCILCALTALGVLLLAASFFAAFLFKTPNFGINIVFLLVGIAWASINVNSYPMVVEMCKGSDIGKFTGYYYTASMAAQVVTPIVAGTLMRKIDYRVLFPYAALFVALSFVTMLFVHHGDAKAEAKKGLEAFEEMDD